MATPFHGSPLFSPDWLQYSLYRGHYLATVRLLDSLDYNVYFHSHKNYQEDLKWDNSDGMLPTVEIVETVYSLLRDYPDTPVVLDPVLTTGAGTALVDDDVVNALKTLLIPITRLS